MFKALLPWDTILHIYNPKSTSDTQRINQPCLIDKIINAGIICSVWYSFNLEKESTFNDFEKLLDKSHLDEIHVRFIKKCGITGIHSWNTILFVLWVR